MTTGMVRVCALVLMSRTIDTIYFRHFHIEHDEGRDRACHTSEPATMMHEIQRLLLVFNPHDAICQSHPASLVGKVGIGVLVLNEENILLHDSALGFVLAIWRLNMPDHVRKRVRRRFPDRS